MEVHGRQPGDLQPIRERFLRDQDLLQEANRERIRRARESMAEIAADRRERVYDARLPDRDVLDLSSAERALDARADEARSHKIDELKRAHAEGTLGTPERIAQAAERILSGESGE